MDHELSTKINVLSNNVLLILCFHASKMENAFGLIQEYHMSTLLQRFLMKSIQNYPHPCMTKGHNFKVKVLKAFKSRLTVP